MRTVVCLISLSLALCLIGCSRNYTPKQMQVTLNESPQIIPGALVNREFFTSPRARPLLGRFFNEEEFRPGRSAVAVISYNAWQNMFRSHPDAIGSKVQLDGRQTTIIGVTDSHFSPAGAGEFWVPQQN